MKPVQSHLISAFVWVQMYRDRMRCHNSAKIGGAKFDQYQIFKPPLRGIFLLMFCLWHTSVGSVFLSNTFRQVIVQFLVAPASGVLFLPKPWLLRCRYWLKKNCSAVLVSRKAFSVYLRLA